MGPIADGRKEFWWEREWRHVRDFSFEPEHIVAAFAPEDQQASLRSRLEEATDDWYDDLTFIDVNWGLERIVGALANVDAGDLRPFRSKKSGVARQVPMSTSRGHPDARPCGTPSHADATASVRPARTPISEIVTPDTLWTTEYNGLAVTALRRSGRDIDDAVLAHIWPTHHENIHFYGILSA